jgi:hypothetical protein
MSLECQVEEEFQNILMALQGCKTCAYLVMSGAFSILHRTGNSFPQPVGPSSVPSLISLSMALHVADGNGEAGHEECRRTYVIHCLGPSRKAQEEVTMAELKWLDAIPKSTLQSAICFTEKRGQKRATTLDLV